LKDKVNESEIYFKKYYQYWHFSTIKKGYSGVCIFSKIKPLKEIYGIGTKKFD